ncbi:hypothetical protein LCGC14_2363780 [marine sediment metagenome]|uniref:Uncharacterized protein n=1 Tax=marine sediment metagenome TaxID=412755 RepID=A0A0F9F0J7_9ZZZZ
MIATTAENLDKFRQVYADAVLPLDASDSEMDAAVAVRELRWEGPRMPLADVVELYASIEHGYNDFKPQVIADLAAEFPDSGIEATPTRINSVGIFLHVGTGLPVNFISGNLNDRVVAFVRANFKADEVDWQPGGETLRVWWD